MVRLYVCAGCARPAYHKEISAHQGAPMALLRDSDQIVKPLIKAQLSPQQRLGLKHVLIHALHQRFGILKFRLCPDKADKGHPEDLAI